MYVCAVPKNDGSSLPGTGIDDNVSGPAEELLTSVHAGAS